MTTEIRSTDEQRIMELVAWPGTHAIAGIVECRAVLSLAAKGDVRIVSGNITRDGGSGMIEVVTHPGYVGDDKGAHR